jgi:hypothetical protein
MRLLFEKGKQRELLSKEKEKLSLTWDEFSELLGIKYGKLITFFREERLIDEITFNKLSFKKDYKKYILKKLDENWGQSKGGNISEGNTKDIKIPTRDKDLAEFWGIMLGDGSLQKIKGYKLGVYGLDVAGHSVDDRDYILNFVRPLAEKLFGIKSRIYESKRSKCIHLNLDSRKIVDYFEDNEFMAGNKIINQVTIPDWVKNDNIFLSACLRGLFDTDGTFYRLTNQNSYQVGFTNNNETLLYDLREGLIKLGIGVSKIIYNRKLVITQRSEIEKFYKLIGFSNSKHLNKIKKLF